MKFTDGYWLMRPGVTPHYPAEAYEITSDDASLTILAPTRPVQGRGDTLNIPALTYRFSAPLPGVIRVEIVHHKGRRIPQPQFELLVDPAFSPDIRIDDDCAALASGPLTVRVARRGAWEVAFHGAGSPLTRSGWRAAAMLDAPEGRFLREQLNLGVGECVYGLGERFGPFVKNGQSIDIWNEDGGTSSEQAYKNIPFYLTNRGYGVFVNHPERVSFEVASEAVERVQFSVSGERLEYFVIYGPTPGEVLERYTALTGRPALPPAWSFGLWLSTSFTTDYSEATVSQVLDQMAQRQLPLHVFHFDCFWMRAFHWSDLEWDPAVFPDPPGMLQRLKERGLRVCVWINPYIAQASALFDEAVANGYLLRRPDGDVWQWDMWQSGMGIVDFTNPAARDWFAGRLLRLVEMGVDCFKTDFGERIPTGVAWFDGSDPQRMHNYFSVLYNRTVFQALEARLGKGNAVVFARSATAGGQQFPLHWGGDSTASFESMAETLRGGLSLGLSGFGFWSHDIGGFENTASPAVYKRWVAFGLLSSHSRLHGSGSYRVPWLFDEEAVDVLRHFTRLKCRLAPYLYAAAVEAHQSGMPVLRAMPLEFPADPGCETLDRQYMLGAALLVAPVFSQGGEVAYYLPAGRWTDFFSGEAVEGPGWRSEQHGYLSLPLRVRTNSLLALGANSECPDYDYAAGLELRLYALQDGAAAQCTVPALDGSPAAWFNAWRKGSEIVLEWGGAPGDWSLLLVGVQALVGLEGGDWEPDPQGVRVTPAAGANRLRLEEAAP